jgi:hypothetical protein
MYEGAGFWIWCLVSLEADSHGEDKLLSKRGGAAH